MESDESGSSQDSFHSSSSSYYEEANEELSASNQHGDGCVWVEPYSDEPIADTNWAADYRAKKQNEIDKYDEFKLRLERMQPVENWYVLFQSCCPIAVSASHVYKQQFV